MFVPWKDTTQIWLLRKFDFYKIVWSVSAYNSRTVYRTGLRLKGEVVYLLIFQHLKFLASVVLNLFYDGVTVKTDN